MYDGDRIVLASYGKKVNQKEYKENNPHLKTSLYYGIIVLSTNILLEFQIMLKITFY